MATELNPYESPQADSLPVKRWRRVSFGALLRALCLGALGGFGVLCFFFIIGLFVYVVPQESRGDREALAVAVMGLIALVGGVFLLHSAWTRLIEKAGPEECDPEE